uniref:Striatin 4 n=1 Tax=Catharus ustulatus TaxID=91951 RepID=A0A8C3Y6F3_CATUS
MSPCPQVPPLPVSPGPRGSPLPEVPDGRALSPKRSWSPRLTLRSHYDAVRALAFVPCHPALVTASEDATLKLWNLHKPLVPKKSAALDVEPVYAFRGHRSGDTGDTGDTGDSGGSGLCCSAGVDARIRCWRLPALDSDPYDGYDPGVLRGFLDGHSDAVWALSFDSHLGTFGTHLGTLGSHLGVLGTLRTQLGTLGTPGDIWDIGDTPGDIWGQWGHT